MNLFSAIFLTFLATTWGKECPTIKSNSKLFCYYSKLTDINSCECSHVILPADADVKSIDRLREAIKGVKILISVNEFNQGLVNILKESKVDGLEINLKKLNSKEDINDFISTVRSKLGSDLYIVLLVPPKTEVLAKFFDFKSLSKSTDLFILQTAFLGANKNVTFHPSRLSGLWDMQNTDSVVDLVTGLGAPLSKLVVAAPVQAFQFTLQNVEYTAPGSPALEVKTINRDELCALMKNGKNWTLERDQDQAGPYIFSGNQWIAFEDSISMDIKAKYSRVRGLAGLALKDLSQDGGSKCESNILESAYNGLSRQARAPRGAVLHSLEREILETNARPLDNIQVSPYRISRVIDTEGHVHSIRQDTRTEFSCSRQGYFVHPRSCNRFYRCVKFDQLSDEFSVFEFDCPAGLAFDERVEVCVWPGSLPHASACSGSSEIAPVPRERFICPTEPGYYADPENCRWFFACLDHGKSPLSAYEFRCPFGLVFDQDRLMCEWPWFVPKCANGAAYGLSLATQNFYGTGFALDQYDGLGTLGTVKLGGLSGTIQKPVAKVYSNAGSATLLGLSNNAAVSLVNAGLLRGESIGVNYQDQGFGGKIVQSNVGSFGSSYQNQGLAGKTIGVGNFGTSYQDQGLGAKLSQNLQYYNEGTKSLHLGTFGTSYQEGVAGNIDIVGGGYSAVGNVKGVDVSNNGANLNFESSTIASAIPTVTSVPIPAIKTVNSFESYNGGVVANIPELQLRVKPATVEKQVYVSSTVAPISYSTPITVSTPRPFSTAYNYKQVATSVGYSYPKPSVVFEEKPLIQQTIVQQPVSVKTVAFVEKPLIQTGVSYAQTGGYESEKSKILSEVKQQTYNQNIQTGGYVYEKPKIQETIVQQPVAVKTEGYVYQKPKIQQQTIVQQPIAVNVYEQKPLVQQTIVKQPAVSYAYNQNVQTGGYVYEKPKIRFEEKPVVQQTIVQQPAVSYAYNQNVQTGGYVYKKPKIQFEEKPVVQQTIVQQPVAVKTQGYVYEKPTVTFEEKPAVSYAYNQNVQTGGYVYEKPKIQFEEKPVVQQTIVQQPVAVKTQGYVYEKPTVAFEEKPAVSYTYNQNVHTGGYVYEKPKVQFQETVVQQPAVTVNTGYVYEKPKIAFEEKPAVTYQNIDLKTDIVRPVTVQTYEYRQPQVQVKGYEYPKPAIKFEENYFYQQPIQTVNYQAPVVQQPVQQLVPLVKQKPAVFKTYTYQKPAVTNYSFKDIVLSTPRPVVQGYSYPKPSVTFVEQPVRNYVASTTVKPEIQGYVYPKPTVSFVEEPKAVVSTYNYVAPTTPKSVITEYRQPAVVSSFNYVASTTVKPEIQGYVYPKPTVNFVEEPKAVVSTYNYVAPTTPKPVITEYRPQVIVQETVKPVITEYKQPAVVSSFNYVASTTVKPQIQGYLYPKPTVNFVEEPKAVVSTYNYVAPTTPKPVITEYRPQVIVQEAVKPVITEYRQPAVISSFNYVASTSVKPQIQGYVYPKPTVNFVEEPKAVVSTYNYVAPTTPKPVITEYRPQVIVQEAVKPVITEYKQPAVVSSFNYVASTTVKPEIQGYIYPKPTVNFVEEPKAVVSTYNYVAPTTPKPVITEYRPQVIVQEAVKPVITEYKQPAVVSSYSFVAPTTPKSAVFTEFREYVTPRPQVVEYRQPTYNYVTSTTPRPAVIQPIITEYRQPAVVSSYSYVAPKTPKPVIQQQIITEYKQPVISTTSRPIVTEYRQPAVVSSYNYVAPTTPKPQVIIQQTTPFVETLQPIKEIPFVKKKTYATTNFDGYRYEKPVVKFEERPIVVENYVKPQDYYYVDKVQSTPRPTLATTLRAIVTSRPIVRYSFSSLDDQVEITSPRVKTTFVVPEVTSTRLPAREYLPVTTTVPTPTREYLPVRGRARLRVSTSTTQAYDEAEEEEIEVTSRRPVKVLKVVRPITKTIIKQNDFLPMLSAKLGAQCTCTSNTVKLRKKPQKIIVVEDDDDDEDEYQVSPNIEDEDGAIIVEDYKYEPQKEVEITPTPEIYIKSTTLTSKIRKRVRVRPVTTPATEIFIKSRVTPVVKIVKEEPSDKEIVKAVRTGLKLVKQAAKEGAKEGTAEVISKSFDRYGPGGLRNKNERLQGTIDCQRAGLFRHPTQCNKFYSCRWDCKKNKFTLHVFNCPVHLTFDSNLGACNWPSQGPACLENTLLPSE